MFSEMVGANRVIPGLLSQFGFYECVDCPIILEAISGSNEIHYLYDGRVVAIYVMQETKTWWCFSEYGINLLRPYIFDTILNCTIKKFKSIPTIDENGEWLR